MKLNMKMHGAGNDFVLMMTAMGSAGGSLLMAR